MTRLRRIVLLLGAGLLLAVLQGCVQRTASTPSGTEPVGPIYGSHTVQQAWTPRGLTLAGVNVRIATYARVNAGDLILHVKADPSSADDLRTLRVKASEIQDSALHRFDFAQPLVPSKSLTLVLESTAQDEANALAVWSIPEQNPNLASSYDGEPTAQRLVFAGIYEEPLLGAMFAQLVGVGLWRAVGWLTTIGLLLPGFLLSWNLLGPRYRAVDRLAATPAFAVALAPLTLLWSTVAQIHIALVTVGTIMVLYNAGSILELVMRREGQPLAPVFSLDSDLADSGQESGGAVSRPQPALSRGRWPFLLALLATLAGLLLRSAALDGAAVPPGGDAFHHAVITRLILDHQGVPSSYVPYAPIASFAYHFGFHAVAAPFASISSNSPVLGVQTAALLLNSLIALSLFFCARAIGLGDTAAVAAALIAAVVSPYPAGLLDLGRYPQTAGLVILPVAAVVAIRVASRGSFGENGSSSGRQIVESIREVGAMAFLGAGLFLTHYRIALSLLGLVAVCLAWSLLRERRLHLRFWFAPISSAALLGVLLVAPWIGRLLGSFTLGIRDSGGRYGPEYFSLERLGAGLSHPLFWPLLGLAVVGIACALVARRVGLLLIGVWAVVLVVFSNPHWVPIPGAGALDSVTLFSSLFFPAALGVGFLLQRARDVLARPMPVMGGGLVAASLCAAAVWGAVLIPSLFEPNDALADAADRQAARWMAATLPPDAKLLVNSAVRPWNPDYVVPTDAGYWMPLLARRATTLLPLVYPGERGVAMSDVEQMEQLSRASTRVGAPDTIAELRASKVTHVYVGARGGPIDEATLDRSPAFRRIYQRGAVSIYELRSETAMTEPEPMLSTSADPTSASTP